MIIAKTSSAVHWDRPWTSGAPDQRRSAPDLTSSFARMMERKAHGIAELMQRESRPHMTIEPRIASIESFTLAPGLITTARA